MKKRQDASSLYAPKEADALTRSEQREEWRLETDRMKVELILEHAEGAQSLLDIGCGWGQILRLLVGRISVLAGVDESRERLVQLKNNVEGIQVYQNKASALDIASKTFDIVLMSHVMHELKEFGKQDELMKALAEIKRVLKSRGRYFIIDHRDPGEGHITIRLRDREMVLLKRFAKNFKCRRVDICISEDEATLSRRDCHDFVTKIWSFGGDAEGLEMKETHTIIKRNELENDLQKAGFEVTKWINFNPIKKMMNYYSIEIIKGDVWDRQFMVIAQKG